LRFSTPLNESELLLHNDTLSIKQLTLRHLHERTLIYFGEQAFPLKALQDTVHRHRQRRDLSHVDVTSACTAANSLNRGSVQRGGSPAEWVSPVGTALLRPFAIHLVVSCS
jgi:hypothetical protein